jgi:hypothetical protein
MINYLIGGVIIPSESIYTLDREFTGHWRIVQAGAIGHRYPSKFGI